MSYLKIEEKDDWKLLPYHPVGTEEHERDLEELRKRNERKLTIAEAKLLGERLMKRRDHDHYCICEIC